MKTFIVDYVRPDGRKDFSTVQANNEAEAIKTFKNRGIDGWSGYNYNEYDVVSVSER